MSAAKSLLTRTASRMITVRELRREIRITQHDLAQMKRQLAELGGGWMPSMRPGTCPARALEYLLEHGESSLREIADALQVSTETATGALRGLVLSGRAEKVARGRWIAAEPCKIGDSQPLTSPPRRV